MGKVALRIGVLVVLLASATFADGQCSFSLGNDTTVCEGTVLNYNAPFGMDSYSWNTGGTSPSITVDSTGQYICTVTQLTGTTNLIVSF